MAERTRGLSSHQLWMIWRVIVAELADFDAAPYREEAGAFLERDDPSLARSLDEILAAERTRLLPLRVEGLPDGWPSPLALAFRSYLGDESGRHLFHIFRLRDLFEVLTKYVSSIALSDLVCRFPVPLELKRTLLLTLRKPALGSWLSYLRAAVQEFRRQNGEMFVREMADYHKRIFEAASNKLVEMRNDYAHGATPPEENCWEDFQMAFPRFVKMLQGASFLKRYPLVCTTEDEAILARGCELSEYGVSPPFGPEAIALQSPDGNGWLEVTPLLRYRLRQEPRGEAPGENRRWFFLFQDLKGNEAVTYLNYEHARRTIDSGAYPKFKLRFPLQKWREIQKGDDAFQLLMEHKEEGFVGRKSELSKIGRWLQVHPRGHLLITGPPGVGKSALAARVCRQDWSQEDRGFWGQIDILHYFISREEAEWSKPEVFLRNLLERLNTGYEIHGLKCSREGNAEELFAELKSKLDELSRVASREGRKLILVIDGLDEALPAEEQIEWGKSLFDYIPLRVPDGVYVVMTGRPIPRVLKLFLDLPDHEHKKQIDLTGLSAQEIRGLLYEAVSKYELAEKYLEGVQARSGGNPQYVKMLLNALMEGRLDQNCVEELPETLEAFYRNTVNLLLKTIAKSQKGSDTLLDLQQMGNVLMTLATAKEPLTSDQIAGINGIPPMAAKGLLAECLEVLHKESTGKRQAQGNGEVLPTYRVFHDSFSQFLLKEYAGKMALDTRRRILVYAASPRRDDAPEREIVDVIEALLHGESLCAEQARDLSLLIQRASKLLTGYDIIRSTLQRRPLEETKDLLTAMAALPDVTTSRLVSEVLVSCYPRYAASLMPLLENLCGGAGRGQAVFGERQRREACAVALQVAAEIAGRNPAQKDQEALIRCFLLCCRNKNPEIRWLGVLALFRAARANQGLGLEVLKRMAGDSVRFGIPLGSRLETFAASALGLLFERTEDEVLRRQLKEMCGEQIRKLKGFRLAMWLGPPIVSRLLEGMPDDYSPVNLGEIKEMKKRLAKDRDLCSALKRLINFIDPESGSENELQSLLEVLHPNQLAVEDGLAVNWPLQFVFVARALAGKRSALEMAYQYWSWAKDTYQVMCQDFMLEMRMIQVGLRYSNQQPLEETWTTRVEEAARHFFYKKEGAVYRIGRPYKGGALFAAFPFLARQQGDAELPILREFIDASCARPDSAHELRENQSPGEMAKILLRILEVNALEYGTYDALARAVALHGLRCFLVHREVLGEDHFEKIASILSGMRNYHAEGVNRLVRELPLDLGKDLELRMRNPGARAKEQSASAGKPKPGKKEKPVVQIGNLISMKTELFYASLLCNPPGKKNPMTQKVQEFLGVLVSPESLPATLRKLAGMTLEWLR